MSASRSWRLSRTCASAATPLSSSSTICASSSVFQTASSCSTADVRLPTESHRLSSTIRGSLRPTLGRSMTLLELAGLRASYGPLEVLHGIDLTVNEGEIVCLLGSNAAGKSTLVKAVLGLVHITGGTIRFAGERIDGLKPDRIIGRGFAVVPEDGQVFVNLTVLENLKMGLYLKRDESAMRAALDRMFGLYPVLRQKQHMKAAVMSGGERQMLAVARALISEP